MSFFTEFKKFAMRGNVVDLAVAVIIGTAFGKIVSSLVNGIIMPLIGIILGGINISDKTLLIGQTVIKWGDLLQNVIDFTLIALSIFMMIKVLNFLKISQENALPKPTQDQALLTEIRDLLKKNNELLEKK
jgi:large conductance mechanosensitive channel